MKLPKIFQNGMLLQRDKPVKVWGTAEPDEVITVSIQGKTTVAHSDAEGNFTAVLPSLAASYNEVMEVSSKTEVLRFEDVAVGEVWIAGGQSNMEFFLRYEKHRQQVSQDLPDVNLRFYDVPEIAFDGQEALFDYSKYAVWRKADEASADYFSAVGYYFERALKEDLDVPVGIVGCNWGGTRSEAWMSEESVKKAGPEWYQDYQNIVNQLDMDEYRASLKTNPDSDTSEPFDPFTELLMPRTLSSEEIAQMLPPDFDFSNMPMPLLAAKDIPGALYEHMLMTIAPYTVRGVIWYQGESDDLPDRQRLYQSMLTAMIADWRALFDDDLPFLIVQLPGWETWLTIEDEDYMTIRACQQKVADTVPGVYLCSISDAGEQKDIHPKNKKVVGERLALLARGHVYGEEIACDPPRAVSASLDGDTVTIRFTNAYGGMRIDGEALAAMRVFSDGTELAFIAACDGDTLKIRLASVPERKLTLAYARDPWYLVNLYNQAGLPAVPFEFEV